MGMDTAPCSQRHQPPIDLQGCADGKRVGTDCRCGYQGELSREHLSRGCFDQSCDVELSFSSFEVVNSDGDGEVNIKVATP